MPYSEIEAAQAKWNQTWRETDDALPGPSRVLVENCHLLPASGVALDLACGLGGNALFLARCGLVTHAWDLSPVALERLQALAARFRFAITVEAHDVEIEPPPVAGFDVIVVSRFLTRSICPNLLAALKPGGLLFYQTYTREKLSTMGPKNPDYLLAPNELLQLFPGLRLLVYREEDRVGDLARGWRDEAMLVGRKV